MRARLIAACFFAIALMLQRDTDQRENVYTLIFDDSNLFGNISREPGWDANVGVPNTGLVPYRD